jgi:DNA-binding NarL/FixJ family response regulator
VPPLRVLIAEDHQLFAETLGLRPDAVLMDLDMPVLDGFRATRLLCRLLPACPVVVLTASPSPDDVHRARAAGAAGYLTKGCSAERLVEALLDACVFPAAAEDESDAPELHQVAQP